MPKAPNELQPLLDHEPPFTTSVEPNQFTNNLHDGHVPPASNDRSTELDTLPETATSGPNLTVDLRLHAHRLAHCRLRHLRHAGKHLQIRR